MEKDFWEEEEIWRCRKHPSRPRSGVCPACLRDRLLRLCPDCAAVRPCSCCASSSNSSFSSFSSLSSADFSRSGGAVGRVANLIDSEPAFRRSRSAAFQFLRPRSDAAAPRPRGWSALWPFSKATAVKEEQGEGTGAAAAKLSRSRSVYVEGNPGNDGEGKAKGWNWHFPSPMKALRHRKSTKVVHERSPLCRG